MGNVTLGRCLGRAEYLLEATKLSLVKTEGGKQSGEGGGYLAPVARIQSIQSVQCTFDDRELCRALFQLVSKMTQYKN